MDANKISDHLGKTISQPQHENVYKGLATKPD